MITISNSNIGMKGGLYSLNDLHKASGGLKRHQPSNFVRKKQTQALIHELKAETSSSSKMRSLEPIRVVEGIPVDGTSQGTFVCRELVYSYGMWISPRFQLMVIRAFDAIANQQTDSRQQLNKLCQELSIINTALTSAGRFLNIVGKQIKPPLQQKIDNTLKQMQPSLELVGGSNGEI